MTPTRRLLLATAIAASLVAPAMAAEPYITAKMMDLTVLVPPPPPKGSAADQADMKAVLDAQAAASDARKAQALFDSAETVYVMFAELLGPKFTEAATPKTSHFFDRIGESEDDTLDAAKPYFGRIRPWLTSDAAKPYAKQTKSNSYPSGHTTRVVICAIMMQQIVPEKKAEIWARAEDYAFSRVVGGMHYPTDVAAGKMTGAAMAAVMLQNPAFKADLEAAKAETRAALGL
jgi:acid phosphatase (class A)